MVFVQLDVNGKVTGMFGCEQNPPTPPGYAVLDDSDPRIAAWRVAQVAPPPKHVSPDALAALLISKGLLAAADVATVKT